MKKTITFIVLTSLVLFGACKKDNIEPDSDKRYTVKVLRNGALQNEYIYTSSKLLNLNHYNNKGELTDYSEFHYDNGKLTLATRVSAKDDSRLNTHYVYDSKGLLTIIEEGKGTPDEKVYNITYDNKDRMRKIGWSKKDLSFTGEFSINAYGNVDKCKYNAVNPNEEINESITYSFEQFNNPIHRFWMVSLDEVSISVNNPVEQIVNIQTTPMGGGQIVYETELKRYKYSYNKEGYILTKVALDTNNQTIDFYEYKYLEN
ncbi:hypothetical protein KFE94_03785 [bacterium SCSIO 12643]|nr:hypothetical protein KFE94_03785 [bacterium SCSIO 12643]